MGSPRVRRRSRRALLAVATVAAFAVVFVAASGAVNGSTFESSDGNLVVNGASGSEDWTNAPSRTRQDDLTGSSQDNALGQGTKEDDPNVSVVQGSIPPNKSDLSRFYTSTEKVGGNTFLYLAWERTNVLGSANMDFELNQTQAVFPASGAATIARSAGDLLLTFDFTNGGAKPTLGLLTWLTSASLPAVNGFATNSCYSANGFPCWGDRIDLGGVADGSINTATVSDPIANASLAGSTFGEMGVNLTLALPNIFGPNPSACESFGSAYLKSRSSASFSAELKDFVTPQRISVSNCGYVLVHKTAADTGADQAGASFTIAPGKTTSSGHNDSDSILALNGHDGWYCIDNLLTNGSYTVTETAAPSGYDIPSPAAHSGLAATPGSCADVSSFTNAPTATTSFSDPVKLGYVLVRKTAADTGANQPGASFTIAPGKVVGTTTNSSDDLLLVSAHPGYYCIDGLRLSSSTFSVTETAAPTGYTLPSPATHSGVSASAGTCGAITWPATASNSFSDPVAVGYVLVHKTAADTGGDQADATFTVAPGKVVGLTTNTSDTIPGADGHPGWYCIDNLRRTSTFSVTETKAPAGYDIPSQATQSGLSASAGSCSDASFTAATATASFIDPLALGAILITKTGKDKHCLGAGNPDSICSALGKRVLAGAAFQLSDGKGHTYSDTTGSVGTVCIPNMVPGSYTLHESSAPTGWAAAADQTVAIAGDTSCAVTPTAANVVDDPLTTITVKTNPAVAGTTESTVKCAGETSDSDANPGHTTGSLTPGTYTCTVVIDP